MYTILTNCIFKRCSITFNIMSRYITKPLLTAFGVVVFPSFASEAITIISHTNQQDSNLFIGQGFAILDILSIQPQKNFHNQSFFKLSKLFTFAVLIMIICFLLSNFLRLSMHNLNMAATISPHRIQPLFVGLCFLGEVYHISL